MSFFNYKNNIHTPFPIPENVKKLIETTLMLERRKFIEEIRNTAPERIHEVIEIHLRFYIRRNGQRADFIENLYKVKEQMKFVEIDYRKKDAFLLWLENEDKVAINVPTNHKKSKSNSIQAPDIALFCQIVEHSKTVKRGFDERQEKFCKKVCEKFSLPYADRVRQKFKDAEHELKETNKNFIKIKEHIIPRLP